jgi:hypothetical protein
MQHDRWIRAGTHARTPERAGWYSICFCWEAEEGIMTEAAYFDGKCWQTDLPIVAWSYRSFATQAEAQNYAEEFDPGYPT